jgi:hypothetical protein
MRRPGNNFIINPLLINQQGQASVFVLVLLGVVLVSAIFLYQSGRITSEKMQLQNAADSAAFGALTLEARSLNFAAYTNRAMIANEVAVGQLIGMLSWADQLTQAEEYADIYTLSIEGIGLLISAALAVETAGVGAGIVETVVNIITTTIDTVAGVMTVIGDAMEAVLEVIVAPTIGGLSLVNEVYSVSQRIYHGATYALVVKNVYQSLDDNIIGRASSRSDVFKKNQSGAQLSDLGVVALVGHFPSYWLGYTTTYSSSTTAKKKKHADEDKKKKEEKKKQKEEEKKNREKEKKKGKTEDNKPEGKEDEDNNKKDEKKEKDEKAKETDSDKNNKAGMGRFAGTVREARDAFSSGGEPEDKTRDWNLELELKIKKTIPLLVTKIHLDFDFIFGAESLGASELRNKSDTFIWSAADTSAVVAKLKVFGKWYPVGPPGAPFGTGVFQAPEHETDLLLATDMRPSFPEAMYGKRSDEVYGGAGSAPHALAWIDVGKGIEEDQIETYNGLRPYRDMAQMDEEKPGKFSMPFEAPFFLVGVTRTFKDTTSKGPQFTGRFDLTRYDSDTNVDRIGAIAKSELYFARPTDLNYFMRKDKHKEKPNLFSPFWQARLVDTNNTDRFLALAMQQKVFWMTKGEKELVGGDSLDKVLSAVDGILEVVADVFNRITKLFL